MSGRYASIYLLSRFQTELDRLLQEAMGLPDGEIKVGEWQPALDIVETPTAVLILVELPGCAADDLTVEVKGPRLVLSGVKPTATPGGRIKFHCMERSQGRFEREIQLLWPVNSHLGTARLTEGLLAIEFPKIQDQRQTVYRLPVVEVTEPAAGAP